MMGAWSFLRQFMYTKFVLVVDEEVNARDWSQVAEAIAKRFDPRRDVVSVTDTPIDYLDFASPESGLGGKIGLDLTAKDFPECDPPQEEGLRSPDDLEGLTAGLLDNDPEITAAALLPEAFGRIAVVRIAKTEPGQGRAAVERAAAFLRDKIALKLAIAVDEDIAVCRLGGPRLGAVDPDGPGARQLGRGDRLARLRRHQQAAAGDSPRLGRKDRHGPEARRAGHPGGGASTGCRGAASRFGRTHERRQRRCPSSSRWEYRGESGAGATDSSMDASSGCPGPRVALRLSEGTEEEERRPYPRIEFGVPIKKIPPTLVEMIWREAAAFVLKLVAGGLPRRW